MERHRRSLDEVIADYLDARRAGNPTDPQMLLEQHPELRRELEAFLRDDAAIGRDVGALVDQRRVEAPTLEGERIGGYDVLDEIDRGSMGVVYRARDASLGREVALKVLARGELADESEVKRFRREAQAVAAINHPHIVALYESGADHGRNFISMELVEGGHLGERWTRETPTNEDVARTVEQIARAVQAAHEQGVLHRDLKPGNVLLTRDGVPKVADFGLAKLREVDGSLTRTGAVIGTPNYVAPETLVDEIVQPAYTTGDVYGLGAILYEGLTGRPPFRGSTVFETLRQVREDEPVRPRALRPEVEVELEAICLKCLEKRPADRYASALEVAEDLRRFLDGRPIRARPGGPVRRIFKWARRRPALASLVATIGLALLVLFAGSLWYGRQLEDSLEAMTAKERESRSNLYAADMSLAYGAWQSGRIERMRELLDRHRDHRAGGEPDFVWSYLDSLANARVFKRDLEASEVAFSRDSSLLFVATGSERSVCVLEASTGQDVATWSGFSERATGVAISPDGQLVATTSAVYNWEEAVTGSVDLWNLATGETRTLARSPRGYLAVEFSPDGRWLAAGGVHGRVQLWSVEDLERAGRTVASFDRAVLGLAWSPDSRRLGAGVDQRGAYVAAPFAADTGTRTIIEDHCHDVAFSPDGRLFAAAFDLSVRVWSVDDWSTVPDTFSVGPQRARSVHFSPCSRFLAVGSRAVGGEGDGTFEIWDVTAATRPLVSIRSAPNYALDVRFSPDGGTLAIAGPKSVSLWTIGALVPSFRVSSVRVTKLISSPSGRWLASEPHFELYKRTDGGFVHVPLAARPPPPATSVAFDPAERLVVIANRSVWLIELDTQRLIPALTTAQGAAHSVGFHPGGDRLAVGSYGRVRIFRLGRSSGQIGVVKTSEFKAHEGRVYGTFWAPSGDLLLTAGEDGRVRLWETSGFRLVGDRGLGLRVEEAIVSQTRRLIAVLGWSRDMAILYLGDDWRTLGTCPLRSIKAPDFGLSCLAFDGMDSVLLAGSGAPYVTCWDVESLQELATFSTPRRTLEAIAVVDGALVISGAGSTDSDISVVGQFGRRSPDAPESPSGSLVDAVRQLERASLAHEQPGAAEQWSEVTSQSLLGDGGCQGAASGDWDGDGDLDLLLAYNGRSRLFTNEGNCEFTEFPGLTRQPGNDYAPAFVDYDSDGDLDAALCEKDGDVVLAENREGKEIGPERVLRSALAHRSFAWIDVDADGRPDLVGGARPTRVLSYRGHGGFVESERPARRELAGKLQVWCDYDRDGDLDAYVSSDGSARLFEYDAGGAFVLRQAALVSPTLRASWASWADFDNDGDFDLLRYRRNGHIVLARNDSQSFEYIPSPAMSPYGFHVHPAWADYDLDGDLDLFLPDNEGDSRLLRNDGDGTFINVTGPRLSNLGSAKCVQFEDYDLDGDPDLFIADWDRRNYLFRNDQSTGHHWLQIDLRGKGANTHGVGATICVVNGERIQTRQLMVQTDSPSLRAQFGLGTETHAERVEIFWPSGTKQVLEQVEGDRLIVVREP